MRRWLARVCGAILAAATVALIVEWRQSYRSTAELTFGRQASASVKPDDMSTAVSLLSRGGRFDVAFIRVPTESASQVLEDYGPTGKSGFFWLKERNLEPAPDTDRRFFKYEEVNQPVPWARQGITFDIRSIRFPHWLAVLVTSSSATLALLPTWRRLKRGRKGLCVECGYDLRSSADRCPECGKPFAPGCSPPYRKPEPASVDARTSSM